MTGVPHPVNPNYLLIPNELQRTTQLLIFCDKAGVREEGSLLALVGPGSSVLPLLTHLENKGIWQGCPFNVTSNSSILCCSEFLCPGSNLFCREPFYSCWLVGLWWQEAAWWAERNKASGVGKLSLHLLCQSIHLSIMWLPCGPWQLAAPYQFSSFLMCKMGMTQISGSLEVTYTNHLQQSPFICRGSIPRPVDAWNWTVLNPPHDDVFPCA